MDSTIPPYGVYTPLVIFFHDDESIDMASTKAHIERMAEGGVAGLVLQGSNGEAPHLDHEERKAIISMARKTLDGKGNKHVRLIVGCGAASVRETLTYLDEAKQSGADFGLVLPPSYWSAAMSVAVVEQFFHSVSLLHYPVGPSSSLGSLFQAMRPTTTDNNELQVAQESKMPILIYNFPGVTGGIDISSDSIIRLANQSPGKIVGVKLTCGNVGKLQRVSSTLSSETFATFGGKSDFFLPALVTGSHGVIAALANVAPKAHVELLRLYDTGELENARKLQSKLSHADWALSKVGVAGVKAVVSHFFSYGNGRGRRPLGVASVSTLDEGIVGPLKEVVDMEKHL